MPWVTCIIYQLGINFLSHAAESAWILTSVVEIKGDEIWCNSVASSPFGYCCLQRTEFLCHTSLVDLQWMEKRVGIGSLTLNQLLASNTHKNNWSVLFVPWRWSHFQKSTWQCTKFWWQFLSWWLWTISVTRISHTQGENPDCLRVLLQWNPLLNSW